MAIGDSYITRDELKDYLSIRTNQTGMETALDWASNSASKEIENHCRRQFNNETTATDRKYKPISHSLTKVDDFWTTTDFVIAVDASGAGSYDSTWAATDYELEPDSGVVEGVPGFPFWRIYALGSQYFPTGPRRNTVRVTAQWGWKAVPDDVKQACFILAAKNYKQADAPFGVAGFSGFGEVRIRELPDVCKKLKPYRRDSVLVG